MKLHTHKLQFKRDRIHSPQTAAKNVHACALRVTQRYIWACRDHVIRKSTCRISHAHARDAGVQRANTHALNLPRDLSHDDALVDHVVRSSGKCVVMSCREAKLLWPTGGSRYSSQNDFSATTLQRHASRCEIRATIDNLRRWCPRTFSEPAKPGNKTL